MVCSTRVAWLVGRVGRMPARRPGGVAPIGGVDVQLRHRLSMAVDLLRRRSHRAAFVVVSIAALAGAAPAAAATTTGWVGPVPVDPGVATVAVAISSMSCSSSSFCMAVSTAGQVLVFQDGSWGPPVQLGDSATAGLVSCAPGGFCVVTALGASLGETLVFTYDAGAWSAPVTVPDFDITDVSCASSSFCLAVDNGGDVLDYNGSSWTSPESIGASGNAHPLADVSCVTSAFCAAVDTSGNLLTIDGTSVISDTPENVFPPNSPLSVSCASTTFCVATGGGMAVTFSSGAWGPPSSIDTTSVTSVSCAANSTFCTAIDDNGYGLSYTAGAWSSPTQLEAPIPLYGSELTSVSCGSVAQCFVTDSAGRLLTLNGASKSVTVLGGGASPQLSCPSQSFCEAVDSEGRAMTLSGDTWSAPTDIDATNALTSVSCPSSSFCAAVDVAGNVLTFNDGSWGAPTRVDASTLSSVSCLSSSFCVAVDVGGNAVMLDGGGWTAPADIDAGGALTSVSCAPSSFCAAVDDDGNALTFNGSAWSAPTQIDPGYAVPAVSCVSSSLCVAGGLAASEGQPEGTIRVFDGTGWQAPIGYNSSGVTGLSCASSWFCLAVDGENTFVDPTTTGYPIFQYINNGVTKGEVESISCVPDSTYCVGIGADGNSWTYAMPASIAPPEILGTAQAGQTLTGTIGAWTNNPTSYAYQWEDCKASVFSCYPIAYATSPTYTVTANDVGYNIELEETATDDGATSADVLSPMTSVVVAAGPVGAVLGTAGVTSGKSVATTDALASARRASVKGDVATDVVTCAGASGASCAVTLSLSVTETISRGHVVAVSAATKPSRKTSERAVGLGSKTITLASGHSQTVRIALSSAGRKLLRARRRLAVSFTAVQHVSAGPRTFTRQTLTFKAAK